MKVQHINPTPKYMKLNLIQHRTKQNMEDSWREKEEPGKLAWKIVKNKTLA